MKKVLVFPRREDVSFYLDTDIDGIILPIDKLAVNSECFFTISQVLSIASHTDKEVCICINKLLMNDDLPYLRDVLLQIKDSSVSKILFYDLAVLQLCRELDISQELVLYQEHLNLNKNTHLFYKKRGVKYSVISNDITLSEINEISKYQSLMMVCYGYLPIFYSRRYLIDNYFKYIGSDKKSYEYSIRNKDDFYKIVSEENGTAIYTKKPINLIRSIDKLNIDYVILNANYIDNDEFMKVMLEYCHNDAGDEEVYEGFLYQSSVYKVDDYE